MLSGPRQSTSDCRYRPRNCGIRSVAPAVDELLEVRDLIAVHLDGGTPTGRLYTVQKSDGHAARHVLNDLAGEMYDRSWSLCLNPEHRLLFVHFHTPAVSQLQCDTSPTGERVGVQRHV